jgi:hypothetical protein
MASGRGEQHPNPDRLRQLERLVRAPLDDPSCLLDDERVDLRDGRGVPSHGAQ